MTNDYDLSGPGTANYSPAKSEPDGIVLFRTRSSHRRPANGEPTPGSAPVLTLPDPAVGGQHGQPDALGWSDGLGKAISKSTSFTGRVITRPSMGANPAVGPVGYSTRTARLRARIEALYTDYTPSNQSVAQEVLNGNE